MDLKKFRKARLEQAMCTANVDLVAASLPENVFYATNGYLTQAMDSLLNGECFVLFSPELEEPIYVVPYGDIPTVLEYQGDNANIFCYGSFRFNGVCDAYRMRQPFLAAANHCHDTMEEALLSAIRSAAKPGSRLAIDASKMPALVYGSVVSALSDMHISEGETIFLDARRIKHPDEIALIERSAQIAEQSLLLALGEFVPGMSELQLQFLYEKHLADFGAVKLFFVATANERAAYSDTVNTPSKILDRSLIRFDFGCRFQGYSSDLARTATVGQPDAKTAARYDALCAGVDAGIEAMTPGTAAKEIFQKVMSATTDAGMTDYQRHHVGHGIGLEAYDLPTISPTSEMVLEESMTFCVETPYYELGWGGLQIEHTVVIENGTARRLDQTSGDLILL